MTGGALSPSAGWWRTNRWGLVALLPALALGVGRPAWSAADDWRSVNPVAPTVSSPGGWVDLGASRVRLAGLGPRLPAGEFGSPPELPLGMVVYRADLAFDLAVPKDLLGCDLELETADGRRYASGPAELTSSFVLSTQCGPDVDALEGSGRTAARGSAWFVVPVGAQPAAVRVIVTRLQPRYAVVRPPAVSADASGAWSGVRFSARSAQTAT